MASEPSSSKGGTTKRGLGQIVDTISVRERPTEAEERVWHLILDYAKWPAPGSADTELGVLMEPEVCHGETEVYTGVQA